MRVTQSMLTNNMLRNLSNSNSDLGKYMDQLSSGKKINRPSDDPVVAMKGMNYRSQVTEIEQFQRNTGEVHNWMDTSDSAMDKATQALQRLRELAVQASNETYEGKQRESIAKEVDQLKEHLVDIANTKVNDKYIFNGTQTNTAPVARDEATGLVTVNSYDSEVLMEVSSGTKLKANVTASSVFGQGLFNKINELSQNLKSGGDPSALGDSITDLDNNLDGIISERADLGARMNRLDLIENRLAEQEVTANRIMAENEDADIEKVIMNLKTQESVHRAALSAGGRIIQPTLMDFLR